MVIEESEPSHDCADSFKIKAAVLENGSDDRFHSCSHRSGRDAADVPSMLDDTDV